MEDAHDIIVAPEHASHDVGELFVHLIIDSNEMAPITDSGNSSQVQPLPPRQRHPPKRFGEWVTSDTFAGMAR